MLRIAAVMWLALVAPALAQEVPAPLQPGAGVDAVQAGCSVCHTLNYIRMNAPFLTQDGWKAEVAKMRAAYGAPIDESSVPEIVAYLAAHYAAPAKP